MKINLSFQSDLELDWNFIDIDLLREYFNQHLSSYDLRLNDFYMIHHKSYLNILAMGFVKMLRNI